MDEVAGFLEVGRTDDTHEVVIRYRNPALDVNGTVRIVVSPRHARYLANLLTEHATYAEDEAIGARNGASIFHPKSRGKQPPRSK